MTRWRIGMMSPNVTTGDFYAIVGSDGWIFVPDPLDATTWDNHRHAHEAMARCPLTKNVTLWVEPVHE